MAQAIVKTFIDSQAARELLKTDYNKAKKEATERVCQWVSAHCASDFKALVEGKNQKAIFRFLEMVNSAVNKSPDALANQGKLAGYLLATLVLACKQETVRFADARTVCSARGSEDTKHIKGVKAQTLRAVLGSVPEASIASMASRTVGQNGFFTRLGITAKTSKGDFAVVNKAHPLLDLVAAHLAELKPNDIARMVPKGK